MTADSSKRIVSPITNTHHRPLGSPGRRGVPALPDRGKRLWRAAPAAALALILLGGSPASAGPTDRLREFFATVNTVLADQETEGQPLERVERIRRLVAEISDVRAASSAALGRDWTVLGPRDQDEFVRLFAEILERAYVGRLAGTARVQSGVGIEYLAESVAGDEATVRTALEARDGDKAMVEYRMVSLQGRWRVRDLVLDGVSTVENYRAQFRHLLHRMPYQGLVGRIKAKLAEVSFMFARSAGQTASASEPAPTDAVQLVRLDERVDDGDERPPVERAPRPLKSRDIGWRMDADDDGLRDAADETPYWVQVAAFRTATAAERLAERLDTGTIVSSAGGRLLLVRVGPFVHAQAVTKLRELEALGHRPFIAAAHD